MFIDPRIFKNNPPVELHGVTAVTSVESLSIPRQNLSPFAKALGDTRLSSGRHCGGFLQERMNRIREL